MQITAGPSHVWPRLTLSPLLALLVTFVLFALMQHLVSPDKVTIIETEDSPVLHFLSEPQDTPVSRKTLPPEPTRSMPPVRQLPQTSPSAEMTPVQVEIAPPVAKISLQISQGFDSQTPTPLVQYQPDYPPQAAREGIEGWVRLSFDVGRDGQVVAARVIDSHPKGHFERNALRAIKRWKYKAASSDGIAIATFNHQLIMHFDMQSVSN